jgi:hypothetical protein
MSQAKKVLLFLVEGRTDENSLGLIFSQIFKAYEVRFEVISMDITADWNSTKSNILASVGSKVKSFLSKNPFIKKGDIQKVIQIVDIDGAFVEGKFVQQSEKFVTYYKEDMIYAKDKKQFLIRNERKSNILLKMIKYSKILASVSYEVLYFSCNLEHVLHNKENLEREEKILLSHEFVDEYDGKTGEAIAYFSESQFAVKGEYLDTWKFIMKELHSLQRYSNVHLLFERV